jgi:peroxiredoxin
METAALWVVLALLGILVTGLVVLTLNLLKQQGRLLLRIERIESLRSSASSGDVLDVHHVEPVHAAAPMGREVGSTVEPFALPDADGGTVSLDTFRGRDVLLVHWHPACGYCRQIAPQLADLEPRLRARGTELVLLSYGDAADNRALAEEYGLGARIGLQEQGRSIPAFEGLGTPVAYLVGGDGRITAPLAFGALDVPELARATAEGRRRLPSDRPLDESRLLRTGLPAGAPAPEFSLPAVDGGRVALSDYRGRRVLLVFSDPDCGPCNELAPRLGELHRRYGDRLAVVMVSRGDVARNRTKAREHRIDLPIGVQPGRRVAKEYGIFATPVAFLVDEEGVIAQEVAQGMDDVLALARDAVAREEAPMT